MSAPLFELGQVVMTPGVIDLPYFARIDNVIAVLVRHQSGDWGEMDPEDCQANTEALTYGYRLMSAYTVDDQKIWVITESDRSVTTLLLPDEY